MFILALMLNQGGVDYKTGTNITATMDYLPDGNIDNITQVLHYDYTTFDDTDSHRFGLYLAIASFFGFVITITQIAKTRWKSE